MLRRVLPGFILFMVLMWLCPQPASAFIPHWDPKEGFFVRQFAYLVFLIAMLFFIYELKQERLERHRGFRFMVWASGFFALWNLDCFVGQLVALHLEELVTVGSPGISQKLLLTDFHTWIYYVTKLDHLFLVPAFVLFYLGIKAFVQEPEIRRR